MENWQTVVAVVISIVAGAALVVLVQLSLAVRSAMAALERSLPRAHRAIDAVAATAEQLDRAMAGVDATRVRSLMEALDSIARTVNRLRDSTRVAAAVGAAVGPAVGAAVKAWRAGHVEDGDGTHHRDVGTGAEGEGGSR